MVGHPHERLVAEVEVEAAVRRSLLQVQEVPVSKSKAGVEAEEVGP